MQLPRPSTLEELAPYLSKFIGIVGRDRWFKRAVQLDAEQQRSPFRWKIVADYHWLELAISHQCDVLAKEGRLVRDLAPMPVRAGLHFAATVVDVHERLSPKGKAVLAGRLRDALKAQTGFAALYLEMDIAQRLTIGGFDLDFPDLEGTGQFDLAFRRGAICGEVECKSLSVDAGRKIHRKDFYRFVEAMTPSLQSHLDRRRREILLVDLDDRLSANVAAQRDLRRLVVQMLTGDATQVAGPSFQVNRLNFDDALPNAPLLEQSKLNAACQKKFGANCHAAGVMDEEGGCLIVMRSKKEDDTSKPLLEAIRKAAAQFSATKPSFIAVQFDDAAPADLMLPHLRRRVGLLSHALYLHYGATHVNAICFSCFDGMVEHQGNAATVSFGVPNPQPEYPVTAADVETFLAHIPDQEYAELIGAPLPADNITSISFARDA